MNRERLNILQVIGMTHTGGSGASSAMLAKKLAERGHRVIYVCNKSSLGYGLLSETGTTLVTSVVMTNKPKPNMEFVKQYRRDIAQIRDLIDKENIDILHVHCSPEYWIGAFAYMLSKRKPVFIRTRHIPVPVKKNLQNLYLFNMTDKIIAVSELIRKNYFNKKGYDESKIETIYDGVDIKRFNSQICDNGIRKEFNIRDDEFLIGNISRLEKVKGHKFFFQAIGEVVKEVPNIKILAVGHRDKKFKDEDMEELKKISTENGFADKVIYSGYRKDVENIMASLDLFVLSSIGSEGSSRATFEAMAMAKPCVVTSVGILPELIENGVNGFLVPPKEPHLMAEAILKLLKDRSLSKEFGIKAYKKVIENFTDEIMMEKTINLYYKLIKEKKI